MTEGLQNQTDAKDINEPKIARSLEIGLVKDGDDNA